MIKVLIIKLSSIGDVVHTLPALAALRRGFERKGQKARIDWLVEEAASGILRGHPMLDNVIVVKKRGWTKDIKKNIKTALSCKGAIRHGARLSGACQKRGLGAGLKG